MQKGDNATHWNYVLKVLVILHVLFFWGGMSCNQIRKGDQIPFRLWHHSNSYLVYQLQRLIYIHITFSQRQSHLKRRQFIGFAETVISKQAISHIDTK